MSTEHNKKIVWRWLEAFNTGDLTAVEECLTEDYVNHGTTEEIGYEAGRRVINQVREVASDAKISIKYIAAEDDIVMVLFTVRGTFTSASGDMSSQVKPFNFTMVDVFRFREGKICEAWVIRDRMEVQEQLGFTHGSSASN